MSTPARFLGALWPLYILGEIGEEGCAGHSVHDLLCPETPAGLRRTYRPILARTNPTAARGMDATPDAELAYWCRVLRASMLTGNPDELTFLPDWLTHEGEVLTNLARLLFLPLFERQDVFLEAMHQRGQA